MITDTLKQVLADESIIAIVTSGEDGPHVVNTWNSYVTVTPEEYLLIPAGRMNKTENNLKKDSRVLLTIGSRNVQGFHYAGTGFLIEGTATIESSGQYFDQMKKRFEWMRAVLIVKAGKITQTL